MAKNRVAPDGPSKRKDNFFQKSNPKFSNCKLQHKNRMEESKSRNSTSFFTKSDNPGPSINPKSSKVHNFRGDQGPKTEKKPFDKKKYRLQKYSKKYKLEQWEDKRKKAVLRGYYKKLKDEDLYPARKIYKEHGNEIDEDNKLVDNNSYERSSVELLDKEKTNDRDDVPPTNSKGRKNKVRRKAHEEFQRIKEEKTEKKELHLKKKIEKEEALQEYKNKKIEKFKRLNKKTKKGQPIMKDRIEMLLERIQNSMK